MGLPRSYVITGASTGIGRACALHLDRRGARVFAGVRKEADGEALRAEASDRLVPILLDVTRQEQIDAAAAHVAHALGDAPLNGLVNNAGVAVGGPVEFTAIDEVRWQYEVNVFGLLATTKSFLPLLRPASGRVVNMGSIGGIVAAPFMTPYAGTKHAVEAITDGLRGELKPWGMHVCVIEPGRIATAIWKKGEDQLAAITSKVGEEGRALYGPSIEAMSATIRKSEAAGIGPDRVARAVEHALTSTRPRTRYVVGVDAHLLSFLRWLLPDRLFDRVYLRAMGLP